MMQNDDGDNNARFASMANANAFFQGKGTGVGVNNITLGSDGSNAKGFNINLKTYRIIAKKYVGGFLPLP